MPIGSSDTNCCSIHRWLDAGGTDVTVHAERPTSVPPVWTPPALNARLSVEHELSRLSRTWGVYAEAVSTLMRIVRSVDRRLLAQEEATDQLRQLADRLALYRANEELRGGIDRPAAGRRTFAF
jgi:hypothetical protein